MADSSINSDDGFADVPWNGARSPSARPAASFRPDPAEMARARAMLAEGKLPAEPEDDRSLAGMLGLAFLVGLAMIGAIVYGIARLVGSLLS